ncbi:MAG: hypothetical protein KBF88_06470 [Polyangiaceae bacterium]|nr:hypothetical protein [Polyangiaceae bacterium]
MVFDLLASDLEILATVARLPVLGEPLWAGLEQLAATDHGFVALDLLRRRADDPERALAIVQRILTSMSKGTMEKTFASLGRREEVVLCALARINRYDHSLLTDEMIAVLIDRVRAGLDRRNPAQLATTAELLAGLIYLQPSPPAVVNLITQTFTLARELYGDHASASRAIVTELTQAMSHNPSLAGSRLGPSLTEWAREPVIGEAVAALVDEHGWSSENATKSCSRYWTLPRGLPHPASTKEATPSPVVPTSDDLARLGMETQKAYAFTRMAPDVCVSEGIALLDDRVCQIRSWFLTPQGLPNTAERMLALVLGDLFVRGHDWSWLGLQSEESKILNAIFGDPAPEPFERKQLAVLSPDGTVAIDLHRAIRRELREPTTAARLYKLVTSFLDPAIRRELKEIGHVWEKPHWGLS